MKAQAVTLMLSVWIALVPREASATAMTGNIHNFVSMRAFSQADVDGLSFTLTGSSFQVTETTAGHAEASHAKLITNEQPDAIRAEIRAQAVADSGYAFASVSLSLDILLANTGPSVVEGVRLVVEFSSFNIGSGGPFGAVVDDGGLEFARFDTGQSGEFIGDRHDCDTRNSNNGLLPSPARSCGVFGPDSSFTLLEFGDVQPGEIHRFQYVLSITVEAMSVPEPPGLASLSLGALFAVAMRRRRR